MRIKYRVSHRDYKRIEWASRDKLRDKLNKPNGGSGIYVPGIIPSSVHLCVYLFISACCFERCSQAVEREFGYSLQTSTIVIKTIKSVKDIKDLSTGLQDSALNDYHGNYRFQ